MQCKALAIAADPEADFSSVPLRDLYLCKDTFAVERLKKRKGSN